MIDESNRAITERSWTEFLAVLIAAAGFALLGDFAPIGIAGGVAIGLLWLTLPVIYAVALGHLLVVALTVDGFETLAIAVAELGLFGMLVAAIPTFYDRGAVTSMTVFVFGLFVFVFGIAFVSSEALWIGALALVVVGALVAYGMHRYELVSLDLVEGAT
ncbi:hypothetical protein [Halalkalicoccus subterraneus]|uniref:hypothetical protein n=1 Tax=Halalkalicoccus subterraneus TaxID=2675002 RepID=UPI000EFD45B0|nr:hypothetical protein [Halalkalicoccus subterraneus]